MSWALTSRMAVIIDWDRVQEVHTLPGYLLGAGHRMSMESWDEELGQLGHQLFTQSYESIFNILITSMAFQCVIAEYWHGIVVQQAKIIHSGGCHFHKDISYLWFLHSVH